MNGMNSGANYFGCSLIYVWPFRANTGQDSMWALFIGCFDSNFKQEYLIMFHPLVKSISLSDGFVHDVGVQLRNINGHTLDFLLFLVILKASGRKTSQN